MGVCNYFLSFLQKVKISYTRGKQERVTLWKVTLWKVTLWRVTLWKVTLWKVTLWRVCCVCEKFTHTQTHTHKHTHTTYFAVENRNTCRGIHKSRALASTARNSQMDLKCFSPPVCARRSFQIHAFVLALE